MTLFGLVLVGLGLLATIGGSFGGGALLVVAGIASAACGHSPAGAHVRRSTSPTAAPRQARPAQPAPPEPPYFPYAGAAFIAGAATGAAWTRDEAPTAPADDEADAVTSDESTDEWVDDVEWSAPHSGAGGFETSDGEVDDVGSDDFGGRGFGGGGWAGGGGDFGGGGFGGGGWEGGDGFAADGDW